MVSGMAEVAGGCLAVAEEVGREREGDRAGIEVLGMKRGKDLSYGKRI
jgi:hypothetical protein